MIRCLCICIPLKVGSLIVGIVSLVSSLAALIHVSKATDNEVANLGLDFDHLESLDRLGLLTVLVLMILLSVMLIIGIITMNSKLILPFLWIGFTQFLVFLPISITFMTILCTSPGSPEDYWWTCFGFVIVPIIEFYFLLIIYNYHQELLDQRGAHQSLP